jgi:murein DD-endopeptidase MepM/ murein hydrolase activator NlpD
MFFSQLAPGIPAKSTLAATFAVLLLTGCSSAIDRFTDYPGKSDTTHTASAPSSGAAGNDDIIQSGPITDAAGRQPGAKKPYNPPVYQPAGRYDARSGNSVVIAPGQTLYSIARANGQTVQSLAAANGLAAPYHVRAGQRIVIPGGARSPANVELAKAPVTATLPGASIHSVQSGDTLFSLGRRYKLHPYAIADLNGLSHNASLRLGQKVRIPSGGRRLASASPDAAVAVVDDSPPDGAFETGPEDSAVGSGKSQQRIAEEPGENAEGAGEEAYSEEPPTPATDATHSFRWPVKGRVISTFGAKPGGTRNEGINIAVPEGAGVRAADSGVVAYAGNELKGYGNLVLIRHQGGWVTAYAHNKELLVKRGDTVKRGDMIARAGRTGSVESPQLHFELRKGATAVDPMKYLASATVAN